MMRGALSAFSGLLLPVQQILAFLAMTAQFFLRGLQRLFRCQRFALCLGQFLPRLIDLLLLRRYARLQRLNFAKIFFSLGGKLTGALFAYG